MNSKLDICDWLFIYSNFSFQKPYPHQKTSFHTLDWKQIEKSYPMHVINKLGLLNILEIPKVWAEELGKPANYFYETPLLDPSAIPYPIARGKDRFGRTFLAARCAPDNPQEYNLKNARILYITLLCINHIRSFTGKTRISWQETFYVGPAPNGRILSSSMNEDDWIVFMRLIQTGRVKVFGGTYYKLI